MVKPDPKKSAASSSSKKPVTSTKKHKKPSEEEVKKRMESLGKNQGTTTMKAAATNRVLEACFKMTTHASTGKMGTNMLLNWSMFPWDVQAMQDANITQGLPVDNHWYDKDSRTNMCKVATPEVGAELIERIKAACPETAKSLKVDLTPPKEYEKPEVAIVMVDSLNVGGEETEKPAMFFTGKMFVLKDVMKAKFGIRYGDIEFAGCSRAAWWSEINSKSLAIEDWLTSMGWAVVIEDFRSFDFADDDDAENQDPNIDA